MRPDHGGACFAGIPGTITQLLTGAAIAPPLPAVLLAGLAERYERVVLVYFDAFSFELATRHADHPLLARAAADGLLTRLTTQFPSTTTAQMPTIHTGLPVGEHGLYEWFVLEPSLDRLIAPLPFAYAGDGQEPLGPHLRPEAVYPAQTMYEWLRDRGVQSVVAGPVGFGVSPASTALLRGVSGAIGFRNVGDGLAELAVELAARPGRAYGFAYIEDIDSLMHKVGTGAPARTHLDDEIANLLDAIEHRLLDALPRGTLVLVTADHGMTPVSPVETTYLNVGAHATELVRHLRCGAEPDGHPLAPAGSCRDLFLHAEPGHLDELVEVLVALFGSSAEVRRTRELLDDGIFGPGASGALRARLGDVVVLPQLGDAVYWYTPGRFRQVLWGQHGGLTPQEMEIPLIALHAEG